MKTKSVLVVEDERCLYSAISRGLRSAGVEAGLDWLTTAERAEDRLEKRSYDLIVCDHHLCGRMTGLELWKSCQVRWPTIPFVMISSLPVQEFLEKLRDCKGSPRFLPKPFSLQELSRIIREEIQ